jgi:hypothetical protein
MQELEEKPALLGVPLDLPKNGDPKETSHHHDPNRTGLLHPIRHFLNTKQPLHHPHQRLHIFLERLQRVMYLLADSRRGRVHFLLEFLLGVSAGQLFGMELALAL